MKKLLIITFSLVTTFHSQAQQGADDDNANAGRFGFRIGAGATVTSVPSFEHMIITANGMVIPNYIHPSNALGIPQVSVVSSTVKMQPGWYMEGEVTYRLPKKYGLTFSLGVKKIRFDYQTTVSDPDPVSLDAINDDYGQTSLLFLTVSPFNVSKSCMHDQVRFRFGPVINFLLSDKTVNTIVIYNSPEAVQAMQPDKVYFDTIGKFAKTIFGLNLNADVKIAGPLSFTLTAQYFLTAVMDTESVYADFTNKDLDSTKPLVLQGGLTFALK